VQTEPAGPRGRRALLDLDLALIGDGVVRLGAMTEAAIDQAVAALETLDVQKAAQVVTNDRAINEAQAQVTSLIVTTIATQSPVAHDLRYMIALTHVAYELERIADHATGVARRVARLTSSPAAGDSSVPAIGRLAISVLHRVLCSLVDLDEAAARAAAKSDDEIDRQYHAFFERALTRMRTDPDWVDAGAHLLFAAKELERIGDRSTNIAEEVVLLATGKSEDLNP